MSETSEHADDPRDRGQAAVAVVLVAAALFVATAGALVTLGRTIVEQSRAQTAADSAALGGLDGGRWLARRLAERHGGELVTFRVEGGRGEVTVEVRVGGRTAAASARSDAPDGTPGEP